MYIKSFDICFYIFTNNVNIDIILSVVNYMNKIVLYKITVKNLHIRKNQKIKKAHLLKRGYSMNIKILEKYLQVCKQYGLEPDWKDLKKFKDIC